MKSPVEWRGEPPVYLYHGTSAPQFDRFDLAVSHGCVWFVDEAERAAELARSFAQAGRHGTAIGTVYKCRVAFSRIAAFLSEDGIYEFGHRCGGRRYDRASILSSAARGLVADGFDGMVDLYENRLTPSFASLRGDAIEIVSSFCMPASLRPVPERRG